MARQLFGLPAAAILLAATVGAQQTVVEDLFARARAAEQREPERAAGLAQLTAAATARGLRCTLGNFLVEVAADKQPRPADGSLGFFVSGDSTYAAEIEIEALTVEALSTKR